MQQWLFESIPIFAEHQHNIWVWFILYNLNEQTLTRSHPGGKIVAGHLGAFAAVIGLLQGYRTPSKIKLFVRVLLHAPGKGVQERWGW